MAHDVQSRGYGRRVPGGAGRQPHYTPRQIRRAVRRARPAPKVFHHGHYRPKPYKHHRPHKRRRITEDSPRWNARTMGNHTGYSEDRKRFFLAGFDLMPHRGSAIPVGSSLANKINRLVSQGKFAPEARVTGPSKLVVPHDPSKWHLEHATGKRYWATGSKASHQLRYPHRQANPLKALARSPYSRFTRPRIKGMLGYGLRRSR